MKIINLTPHTINLHDRDGRVKPFFSEGVARVETREVYEGNMGSASEPIPVFTQEYGEVENLPEESPDVFFIVSGLVRAALPNRMDLLSPGGLLRDDKGRVIGCKYFVCN